MIDWTASMQQTFEFYIVDPGTWKDKMRLATITSCNISRDLDQDTLGSATIDITDSIGEQYVRVYLVATQNGITEKHPLGTVLVQTPSFSFDGLVKTMSMDAYTPLLELKENSPPVGFYIKKGEDVMVNAYKLMDENMRCPIVEPITPSTKLSSNFVADINDNWLTFLKSLISASTTSTCYLVDKYTDSKGITKYAKTTNSIVYPCDYINQNGIKVSVEIDELLVKTETGEVLFKAEESIDKEVVNTFYFTVVETGIINYRLGLDEMGRVIFEPDLDPDSMVPVWTYTDDNSSILYPDISMSHDLYGIPNVVLVTYSDNTSYIEKRIANDNPNSPTSIQARGREIVHRVVNPDIHGIANAATSAIKEELINKYATDLLKSLSSVEYTLSYSHGYCPVRLGDCVRLIMVVAVPMSMRIRGALYSARAATAITMRSLPT